LNRTASRWLRNAEKAKQAKMQQSRFFHTGWRVVRLMLWAFSLFAAIVAVRGINWSSVVRDINTTKTGIEAAKPVKPNRPIQEPARRKTQNESKPKPKAPADADDNGVTEILLHFPARIPQDLITDTSSGAELAVEPVGSTLSRNIGLLTVKSYVRARVYIDDQFSGYTPRSIKLNVGEHKLTLLADGYEEWSRNLRLKGSQQIGIMAALLKKAA
jgi:hypothetical protein